MKTLLPEKLWEVGVLDEACGVGSHQVEETDIQRTTEVRHICKVTESLVSVQDVQLVLGFS